MKQTVVPNRNMIMLAVAAGWAIGRQADRVAYWDFGPGAQPKWNEIQNTTRDIQVLSNHLLVRYKALVWNRPMAPTDSGRSGSAKNTAHRKTG